MTLLFASLVALAVGPAVLALARRSPAMLDALDGFVYVAIGGLVVLYVLPDAYVRAGWWVVPAAAVGLAGPSFVERRIQRSAHHAHAAALVLACVALGLHSLLDGIALVSSSDGAGAHAHSHSHGSGLALAIVLHRLPVGIMLWWLVQPAYGRVVAAFSLVAVALTTVVGFAVGPALLGALASQPMGLFIALVGGSLLHVVLHQSHPIEPLPSSAGASPRQWPAGLSPSGLGAAAGALLLLVLHQAELSAVASHAHDELGTGGLFLHLALASAPALVLAYGMAGLVQAFLPKASMDWLSRGTGFGQAARGVAFGLPLPICSCGVIPVYRSLVMKGAPPSAAMAFLVATPELGLDAVLLSVPLLGGPMTVARVLCATLVALLVGWIVGRRAEAIEPIVEVEVPDADGSELTLGQRFAVAMRTGYGEIVDGTAPWILVGLVIAAVAAPLLDSPWLAGLSGPGEVAVFAALGLPVYVCASGATPMVAVLLAAGVSPGAGIAFLLAGPATNVTTFGILSQLHGRGVAVGFGVLIAVLCVLLGVAVNVLVPDAGQFAMAMGSGHDSSWLSEAFLLALALIFVASILRRGPRPFVAKVFAQAGETTHDHDHDDHREGEAHSAPDSMPVETPSCCSGA